MDWQLCVRMILINILLLFLAFVCNGGYMTDSSLCLRILLRESNVLMLEKICSAFVYANGEVSLFRAV